MIDLHIHSNYSDGALSPKEIIDIAKNNGVKVIAIADHDTIDAYNDEVINYAKKSGIKLIPGVEISTKTDKYGIHVLGYNFSLDNDVLKEKLNLLCNARRNYLYNVSAKLMELGYKVNILELEQIKNVTKAHISLDIISNPVNRDLLLKEFGHIPSKGEFIETLMNEGCKAFVLKESITPGEVAKVIRDAGGKVVLAHPVAYKYEDNQTIDELVKLLKELKADGIEANYIYIDKDSNKINECIFWREFAKEYKLITTIGSDFHFEDEIHPKIGLINEDLFLSEDELDNIVNNLLN